MEDYKLISLGNGGAAKVDVGDFEWLNQWNWHRTQDGYAARTVKLDGKRSTARMHRIINNTPDGFHTDHINQDRLDNRRLNLRTATHSQNLHNAKISKSNTTGFKGVSWSKEKRKWTSQIQVNNRTIRFGYFETAEEAAQAYQDYVATGEIKKRKKIINDCRNSPNAKAVRCIELDKVFPSINKAIKFIRQSISPTASFVLILKAINNRAITAYGYHWALLESEK